MDGQRQIAPDLIVQKPEKIAVPLQDLLVPAHFRHPQATREVRLGDAVVAYALLRVRRRSIGFTVGADGLAVRAPTWVTLAAVDAALREKSGWILRKLDEARERQQRLEHARIDWRDGAVLPYLGVPLRVVLDPGLATVARGAVRNAEAPTLYLHAEHAKRPREFAIEHQAVPSVDGRLDLDAVLAVLAARGINEVQLEAGATLAGAFLSAGLVDELLLYVAPVLLGERARPLFHGLQIDAMAQRLHLRQVDCRSVGEDLRVLLRPAKEDR